MTALPPDVSAYDQLYLYSGTRGRETFILQLVVDAHGAQTATGDTKPIAVVYALIGLYLHVEKAFTGLRVQQVHMHLGKRKQQWPKIALPAFRGSMTAADVLKVREGPERDAAISDWCRSVWEAYSESRDAIVRLLHRIASTHWQRCPPANTVLFHGFDAGGCLFVRRNQSRRSRVRPRGGGMNPMHREAPGEL